MEKVIESKDIPERVRMEVHNLRQEQQKLQLAINGIAFGLAANLEPGNYGFDENLNLVKIV